MAALCKSFFVPTCPRSVLGFSLYVLVSLLLSFKCLHVALVLSWACLRVCTISFDALAMTFFSQKAFGRTLEGPQKGYI